MSLSLEFHVHSISPEPFERYLLNLGQMFALVRWYAEPITQQCRLKVMVTIEGHQFEPWILRQLHCHSAAGDIAVLQTALFLWWYIARDKKGYLNFSTYVVVLISTSNVINNICLCGEIRKISVLFCRKEVCYLELLWCQILHIKNKCTAKNKCTCTYAPNRIN